MQPLFGIYLYAKTHLFNLRQFMQKYQAVSLAKQCNVISEGVEIDPFETVTTQLIAYCFFIYHHAE
jgi:hypothetical protein